MLMRIVIAVIVAIAVALGCVIVGNLLDLLKVGLATTIGNFLIAWGWAIGVLVGLLRFAGGLT